MSLQDLEIRARTLSTRQRPYAQVIVRNATVPARRATIVAAGVWFELGWFVPPPDPITHLPLPPPVNPLGEYLLGPIRVRIEPGGSSSFYMNDPRYYVKRVAASIRVRFGLEDRLLLPAEHVFHLSVTNPLILENPPPQHLNVAATFRARRQAPVAAKDASQCFEFVTL